jgi:hypothetical protein
MRAAFVLSPTMFPARAPVHHFTADTTCGLFLSKRNLIPETRLLDALHCNMASATIVAAMTSVAKRSCGKIIDSMTT